jgi:aminopeptidase N
MDLVSDPLGSYYGQAPPSIVYLGFGVFWPTAKTNLDSRGDISSFANTVVAHEIGHQWWGSAIVNKNFGNYWFVETLAEYSSALYSENLARFESKEKDPEKAAKKGWAAYMKGVEEWRRFLMDRPNLFTSVQHSDSMMPGVEPGARFGAIYNKGPYAFHMMRLLFGEEKFFKFLKDLAQELEGREIVSRDIQRIAESSLCGFDAQGNPCTYDLEWFFDQWIRGVGMPEYSFHYTYRQAEDGNWVVEGDIKQRVVIGAEKTPMPGQVFRGRTSITVIDKQGVEYSVPVVIDAAVTPFAFKVPKEPLDIVLNKNGGMLAHDVLVNRDF